MVLRLYQLDFGDTLPLQISTPIHNTNFFDLIPILGELTLFNTGKFTFFSGDNECRILIQYITGSSSASSYVLIYYSCIGYQQFQV